MACWQVYQLVEVHLGTRALSPEPWQAPTLPGWASLLGFLVGAPGEGQGETMCP